jgi:ATP-dependent DNA helicase PIF1
MNKEQLNAVERVKLGNNIYLSGVGGSGKSYTLTNIVNWAQSNQKQIATTASTGTAAYLIKGRTIHSYLGIGLGKKSAEELAVYVKYNRPYIVKKLRTLDILIIDEISMINDELFDKISKFLQIIRNCAKSFGGIQVILCGDFAQLPPTERTQKKYCFLSAEWDRSSIEVITLTQMMRQQYDLVFQKMLTELRFGICSDESIKILKKLKKTKFEERDDGIIPTILYSMNVDIDKINNSKYNELIDNGAKKQLYTATFSSSGEHWAKSIKIPERIELCVGCQVVLTWNLSQDDGLINGSRGVVIAIDKNGPTVHFANGKEILIEMTKIENEDDSNCWVSFVPLKLAYALTIHRAQGMTLDLVIIDLGESIFEYGQAYTAISRAKNLDSIKLLDFKSSSFRTHKDVIKFYENN